MSELLRVGLVGAGRIGRVHAENLAHRLPRARLVVVADVSERAAASCAKDVGVARVETDYRALTDDREVDAVVICSSTDSHLEVTEAAAAAGKHVFVEKPVAPSLPEIDRALDAVRRAGVTLQVGFNRRFDASYRRVRDAVAGGEIGEPHLLHLISRDPAPPPIEYVQRSGGMFLDMTVHDFDMARFLVESEVEEVFTMAEVRVDPAIGEAGDVDTAVVMLRFANGVIGTIDNSRRAVYGYDQRAEVFGSAGAVSSANHFPNAVTVSTASAVARDLPLNFFIERYAESYRLEMEYFVAAVLDGGDVPVTGEDGRKSVILGMAAGRSLEEGRPMRVDG